MEPAQNTAPAGLRLSGLRLLGPRQRRWTRAVQACILLALLGLSTGCASLTNPVANGVPVRRLPPELIEPSKDGDLTIPLTLLGQPPSAVYRLDAGDVLGVWIDSILGDRTLGTPLHVAPPVHIKDQRRLAPALGYPITVAEDGTISLPLVDPISVKGLNLKDAEKAIREAYTVKKQVLKQGNERILVSLLQPRTVQVVVLRQETPAFAPGVDGGVVNTGRRGSGQFVEMPANESDVLHALTETGGLPGLDAYNQVIIFRQAFRTGPEGGAIAQQFQLKGNPAAGLLLPGMGQVICIPLRGHGGQPPPFNPDDVILRQGDVVFLEARDNDIFFTGGLLPAGEHLLPRDRSLDVVEAVMRSRGPILNGAFGTNTLAGNLINPGFGNPSPSLLTVVRRLPGGGQVPIRVDLNKALVDRRERLIVKAGDVLLLQEAPNEAMARYFSQSFFNFSYTWQAISGSRSTGVVDILTPQTIPGRIGVDILQNR